MTVPYDLVVRGGRVVTGHKTELQDVAIRGGKIVALRRSLSRGDAQEVDASGCYVLPGGVDAHTHFENRAPLDGLMTADDWESGSRAAAAGGVTTVVNYAFQEPGEQLLHTVATDVARAKASSLIDFSVHPVITDMDPSDISSTLGDLVREGVTSVKVFTGPVGIGLQERELMSVLSAAAQVGMLVAVHPEDAGLSRFLDSAGVGPLSSSVIERWLRSHPPAVEAFAVGRVSNLASFFGTAVYFVHISSAEALRAVVAGRLGGGVVFGETRPAYLLLDESRYLGSQEDAALAVCLPPLRTLGDQRALWDGLRRGDLQTIGSDHTARWSGEKLGALRGGGPIPAGFGGVQTELGLVFGRGVNEGRITIHQFAKVTSENPSKLFGLWPRKGRIGVGGDADLVIIDPGRKVEVQSGMLESRSDFDVHTGLRACGWPVVTISGGSIVWRDGAIVEGPRHGRLVRRKIVEYRALALRK